MTGDEPNYDDVAGDAPGVPDGEGTTPGEFERDPETTQLDFPYFDPEVSAIASKDDGEIYVTTGDYADNETLQHQVDEHYRRDDGGVVQLLGDFNGFACFRYVQRDGSFDAANDYGSVAMVTWARWADEFEWIQAGKSDL